MPIKCQRKVHSTLHSILKDNGHIIERKDTVKSNRLKNFTHNHGLNKLEFMLQFVDFCKYNCLYLRVNALCFF
jgi:hypothetical protein